MAKINAILRYHYKIEPERLSTKEWARLFNEYVYVRGIELKNFEVAFKAALADVLSQAFGEKR